MPEERLKVYKMLGLRVAVRPEGDLEASGVFTDGFSVCTPEPARA